MAEGRVRENEQGVERVVEVGESAVAGVHAPAAVEEKDDLLIALVLVFPRNGSSVFGRRLPIDLLDRVSFAVVAKLMEFHALTAAAAFADSHHAHAVCGGEQPVAHGRTKIGIHMDLVLRVDPLGIRPQAPGRLAQHLDRAKVMGSAEQGPEAIAEAHKALGRKRGILGQRAHLGLRRVMVVYRDLPGTRVRVAKGDFDRREQAHGERIRHDAFRSQGRSAQQEPRIRREKCRERDRSERPQRCHAFRHRSAEAQGDPHPDAEQCSPGRSHVRGASTS